MGAHQKLSCKLQVAQLLARSTDRFPPINSPIRMLEEGGEREGEKKKKLQSNSQLLWASNKCTILWDLAKGLNYHRSSVIMGKSIGKHRNH